MDGSVSKRPGWSYPSAKWIRENITDSRVLLLTDRTELDDQIEKVFAVDGGIHDNSWSVTLKAREPALAKTISSIALDGGAYVKNITISEASGDRTSIVFSEIQTGDAAMSVDEAALF